MATMHEFLRANRAELIARCRAKATQRLLPGMPSVESEYGIPQFLTQLTETFRLEQTPEAMARHQALGAKRPSLVLVPTDIASTAARHGEELRHQGLTIDQVVHCYGDVCQALTELAMENDVPISADAFHTFNRCLDDAIADAVTSFTRDPVSAIPEAQGVTTDGTRGSREHRMRDLLETALVTFEALKEGRVGMRGTTAALHERSLLDLRDLLDRALAEARPAA